MQIKSFLGDCSYNERERSYSLEQKPYLEAQQEKKRDTNEAALILIKRDSRNQPSALS